MPNVTITIVPLVFVVFVAIGLWVGYFLRRRAAGARREGFPVLPPDSRPKGEE